MTPPRQIRTEFLLRSLKIPDSRWPFMKSTRNPNRRPTHPGEVLREDVLPALSMTQTEFALRLGVSRLTVSKILHEKRSLTPAIAARIAKLLNTTADGWLRMQVALDLWAVQQNPKMLAVIKPIKPIHYGAQSLIHMFAPSPRCLILRGRFASVQA